MHELYQVPKSNWESIYVNYHPTGLGAFPNPPTPLLFPPEKNTNTTTAATTDLAKTPAEDGKGPDVTTWVSPIVDASKGRLRSSAGRMARDMGDGNEKYGDDPYA
jgi:hypothetical protein